VDIKSYEQGILDERDRIAGFLTRLANDLKDFGDNADATFVEEILEGVLND
jgi:hypothetical protein